MVPKVLETSAHRPLGMSAWGSQLCSAKPAWSQPRCVLWPECFGVTSQWLWEWSWEQPLISPGLSSALPEEDMGDRHILNTSTNALRRIFHILGLKSPHCCINFSPPPSLTTDCTRKRKTNNQELKKGRSSDPLHEELPSFQGDCFLNFSCYGLIKCCSSSTKPW